MNRYSREYYLSLDKKYRITVDSDMKFSKILKQGNQFINTYHHPYSKVLELKYDLKYDNEVNKITQLIPFRLTRSSKYIQGVNSLKLL